MSKANAITLADFASRQLHLVCLEVDHHFRLIAAVGNLEHYGLQALRFGNDCREALPLLYTMDPAESITLHRLQLETGPVFDLHYNPGLLWLVGSQTAHDREQEQQQEAHDFALLNDQLQAATDKLRAAYRELKFTHQQLENATAARNRFVASMSHEFRTPISSVLGYANRLAAADDAKNVLTRPIQRGARQLLTLVDNLLDQAQLDAGELTIQPMPMAPAELIEDLQAVFQPLADDKQLSLSIMSSPSLPDVIEIDATRLRQIVVNLIGNAIKYTDNGDVSAKLDWQDETLTVQVQDSGPGIPPEARERIFQPFEQLAGHGAGGAGLGLALCRQLTERMGGTIQLLPSSSGSLFEARMPAPAVVVPTDATENAAAARKVLLLDDDPDVGQLTELYLADAGFNVQRCASITDALSAAEREAPELLVLDMHLPDGTAVDAVQKLGDMGVDAPWIALTASPSATDRAAASGADCKRYLMKPVPPETLIDTLRQIGNSL